MRLFHTGFEIDPGTAVTFAVTANGPEGSWAGSGTRGTRNTVEQRTGSSCLDLTVITTATSYIGVSTQNVASTSYFARAYLKFSSMPLSSTTKVISTSVAAKVSLRISAAGKAQLWNDSTETQIGSDSAATIVAGTYYRFELRYDLNASSVLSGAAARVNGVEFASTSSLSLAGGVSGFTIGIITPAGAGFNLHCYVDDVAVNDSSSIANNSWVGEGAVILMKPVADAQVGSWTGGAGGTTNLYQGIDNTPPIGAAPPGTNTSQARSVDASGNNATDEYRGNCGSYTAAGVGASDTVDAITVWFCHGEEVNAGSKNVSVGAQANPAIAYQSYVAGDDQGAFGAYPTRWTWAPTVITNLPSVVKGDPLVLAMRKTENTIRAASVCFLGAYVSYATSGSNIATKAGFGRENG